MYILDISAFYHNSAARLLRDGEVVEAAQEERFMQKKGDISLPSHAIGCCLLAGGSSPEDLAAVACYDKPLLEFERILETHLGVPPRGIRSSLMAGPLWLKDKLFIDRQILDGVGYRGKILYAEHHEDPAQLLWNRQ